MERNKHRYYREYTLGITKEKKYNLSIIVPFLNDEGLIKLYHSLKDSIGNTFTWEVIAVGPYIPKHTQSLSNFRYIQDYGSPSRAFCIGAELAEGEYITFGTDDAIAQPNALGEALNLIYTGQTVVCIIRYTEGINVYGPNHAKHFDHPSWRAGYHADLRISNVDPNWFIGLPLLETDLYRNYGGLDCNYQHINLNIYKMLFAMQKAGYRFITSPNFVYHVDFDTSRQPDTHPILKAGKEDYEVFVNDMTNKVYFPSHSWTEVENKWNKRWK